jgi:hypothetical protein
MTHTQWQKRIRQSLSDLASRPERVLASLERLVNRIDRDTRTGIGDWHMEQTLQAVSLAQSHLKNHHESARIMLAVAERHEQQTTYHRHAYVSACAAAALELASAGDRAAAARILRKADTAARALRPADMLFRTARQVVNTMPRRKSRTAKGASAS